MSKLDSLPPEILFEVLEYVTIAHNRCPAPIHPLNAVASTNRHLHAVADEYTRGLLSRHTNFTAIKHSKTFSYRKKWLAETCQFCRRKSQRRSILYRTLTCCRLCDKQKFLKMTMTQATREHHLSKLDLFTPNALHPTLPPLTTGLYTVMGNACTMILESDVHARQDHIMRLLGANGQEIQVARRPAAHDRIIAHMGIYYCCGNGRRPGGWRDAPTLSEAAMEKTAKSMHTKEGRKEYVRKNLQREWEALGMASGQSKDDTLEIDDGD